MVVRSVDFGAWLAHLCTAGEELSRLAETRRAVPWHARAAQHFGEAHAREKNATISSNEHHPDVIVRFMEKDGRRVAVVKHTGATLEVNTRNVGVFTATKDQAKLGVYVDLLAAAHRAHEPLERHAP